MPLLRYPFKPSNTALLNPTESTTFSAFAPDQTQTFTISVTRNFKPYRHSKAYFPLGLPAGLLVSDIVIAGAALTGYTATFTIYNGTSNTITPATQPIILYQPE